MQVRGEDEPWDIDPEEFLRALPLSNETQERLIRAFEQADAPESFAKFLKSLPPGKRSKEDIDRQLRENRGER